MRDNIKVRDVLYFLDTGIIEHRNTTNDLAWEQFIEELYLQEQINETEATGDAFIGHASE